MAKARAIIKRRQAVVNIRKIARTMELIATAQFKRAFDRAVAAGAYTEKIAELVRDIAAHGGEARHPLLEPRDPVRRAWLVVLTANRGLCGGYNSGVLRVAEEKRHELAGQDVDTQLYVCGKRGINFYRFRGVEAAERDTRFEDKPAFGDVEAIADRFIDEFVGREADAVYVAYTKFLSSSRQEPVVEQLLPVESIGDEGEAGAGHAVEYEFKPDPTSILSALVPVTFKTRLFKCFLDAAVSEQVARMVAMHGAVENAETMTKTLTRMYNRARQTQITNEITELLGGAEALEG